VEVSNLLNASTMVLQNVVKKDEDNKDMLKLKKQIEYWKEQAGLPPNQRIREWASYEDIGGERVLEDD
jgi:hypothetical protein